MSNQFNRILKLIKKTGDTVIVTEPDGKETYVVMDLDRYESMIDVMAEDFDGYNDDLEDLTDDDEDSVDEGDEGDESWEIPDDFYIQEPEGGLADEPEQKDLNIWNTMKSAQESGETWDVNKMNSNELGELERQYKAFAKRNVEESITDTPSIDADSVKSSKNIDDFAEEQFYLEPIE